MNLKILQKMAALSTASLIPEVKQLGGRPGLAVNWGGRLFVDCRFSPISVVESIIIFLEFV